MLGFGWRKNVAGVKMQPDSKNSSCCQVTKHLTNLWTLFASVALIDIIYAKEFGHTHTSLYRSYQMGVRYDPPPLSPSGLKPTVRIHSHKENKYYPHF